MAQDPSTTTIVLGAAGILFLGMINPLANDLYRRITGKEFATKKDIESLQKELQSLKDAGTTAQDAQRTQCDRRHEQEKQDCESCKAATKASICSIQHEGAKNRRLLLLIAIQLNVPQDKLEDYL